METLKEKISKDYLEAFKAGQKLKKNLLGVVKSEITTQEKLPSNVNNESLPDIEVIKILKKIVKNLHETLSQTNSIEAGEELLILEEYLPKQMNEMEIREEVSKIILELNVHAPGDMGKVMGGFSKKFSGKADNKLVSIVVKELLTGQ